MNDKKLALSISVAGAVAWTAWVSMIVLLAVAVIEDDLMWAAFALAVSAMAATLHIRCYLIHLDGNLRCAYEIGREAERVIQLRSSR